MGDFQLAANSFPIWAILWCFYPVGSLVAIEYFLRLTDDDDDDDEGGGVMTPVYQFFWSIMDKEHPYWRWAELINGRMAMVGIVAMVLSKLPHNHLFFGLYY